MVKQPRRRMDHATALLRSYFFILRWEDERQILIPALTEWSFHSPAFLQTQLISPGLLSFCQLLISGLPHLSRLQPLNLRLLPSQPFNPRRFLIGATQYSGPSGECNKAEQTGQIRDSGGSYGKASFSRKQLLWSVTASGGDSVVQPFCRRE